MKSEALIFVTVVLEYFLLLSAIVIFFVRRRYLAKAELDLLGIGLIISFIFPVLGTLSGKLMRIDMVQTTILAENITLFFDFLLILATYHKQQIIKEEFIWIIGIVFLFVWLAELMPQSVAAMDKLPKAHLFVAVSMVVGVLMYWLHILHKINFYYFRSPLFWISIGWFVYYFLDGITYINFRTLSFINQSIILSAKVIISIIFNSCYIIGFWKSKDWGQKGFAIK
jgi:hypothetical protein